MAGLVQEVFPMKLRFIAAALLAVLISTLVVAPLEANAAPQGGGTAALQGVDGTVTNLVSSFDRATDTTAVSGSFTDTAGNVTDFTTTLLDATGTCEILHLVLGPLDLNLLGVMVHLDQVVLDITAEAGPGNLLGNLLCAVAHLLDSSASGNALANLLNHIFSLLG
jgi:hypothetical protein